MRVLMVTVGATPQVVTETVYALLEQGWVPERILLLTTAEGERLFTEGAPPLVGSGGRLAALYAARAAGQPVPEAEILLPRLGGAIMADIRTHEEVTAFAETLLKAVADVTADRESELHLSLAGGRKTMSFLAGSVLSFFGRPQDRLSHVLVEPAEYESSNLWWPGQPEPVTTRSGKTLDPNGASVLLHEVPYLKIRPFVRAEQLFEGGGPASYAEAVRRANEALAIDTLTIDLGKRAVSIGSRSFSGPGFEPRGLAALGLVALAHREGRQLTFERGADYEKALAVNGSIETASIGFARLYALLTAADGEEPVDLKELAANPGVAARFDERVRSLREPLYDKGFATLMSRIKSKVRRSFGAETAGRLFPRTVSLGFEPAGIQVVPPAGSETVVASVLNGA